MAVKIRLRRMGYEEGSDLQNHRSRFQISRETVDFIEEIGTYDPNTDPSTFKVNEELAKKWLDNGAQPDRNRRQDLQGSRNREIRQLCKADGYANEQ